MLLLVKRCAEGQNFVALSLWNCTTVRWKENIWSRLKRVVTMPRPVIGTVKDAVLVVLLVILLVEEFKSIYVD